ncbi:putative F-box/LRR-repeat protein 23 [Trifolium pratense]|uniref:putative F-box/LRR-repeat protein 23 n=1 Tax=Trifolium pratense TaxID=57577 RepID=UPI001E6910AF|nr:putative F-box/LRR-repeat protein 23 [Trifolium pratense]
MNSFPVKELEGESPNWLELPTDITTNILQRLNSIDILTSACQVSPLWWNISKDPLMWRTLKNCEEVSDKGFIECVMKLPLLEELNITYNEQLSKDSIEVVARSCPLLKSLEYGRSVDDEYVEDYNNEAYAIAETMPGLHNLKISGINFIDNDGVRAILDGCPLLESFDLSYCFNLYLTRSLQIRCLEQIKNVKLPFICSSDDWDSDN